MTTVRDWLSAHWPKLVLTVLGLVTGYISANYPTTAPAPVPAPAPHHVAPQPAPPPAAEPAHKSGRVYGWVRPSADEQPERVYSAPPHLVDHLPPAVHLMTAPAAEVPPGLPFDQGQLGSCGPHSAAAAIMYADLRAGRTGLPPPSREFIYYETRRLMGTIPQDSGVSNATMVRALAQSGYCDEQLCPYSVARFRVRPGAAAYRQAAGRKVRDYSSVPQSLSTMKACLAAGDPFVFGFTVYQSFESPAVDATGVVPVPRAGEPQLGGHDVLIVGYDDARGAFRFLNSWGPNWGDRGFGWMPYPYAASPQLAGDFWRVGSGRTGVTFPRLGPAEAEAPEHALAP